MIPNFEDIDEFVKNYNGIDIYYNKFDDEYYCNIGGEYASDSILSDLEDEIYDYLYGGDDDEYFYVNDNDDPFIWED